MPSGACFSGAAAQSGSGCATCKPCFSAAWRTAHGGYVGIEAAFGGRPRLPHGLHGVYISRFASVGRDCCIYQNVTIGEIGRAAPRIGDRCLIGAGAILVGGITIGSDVKIGAGAVVHTDVPDGSTVVPGAARILKKGRGA